MNLATVEATKDWLGIETDTDDLLLERLIAAASVRIQNYVGGWTFGSADHNEYYTGDGGRTLTPNYFPIISVTSLTVDGEAIPAYTEDDGGYIIDGHRVVLNGYVFTGSFPVSGDYNNVQLIYSAGMTSSEARTIPAATPYTLVPVEQWAQDLGVIFTGGAALTKVTGTPVTGQYAVNTLGTYTFAAADTGRAVTLSYAYVPADIVDATIQLVAIRYSEKTRIGQRSKILGGETISFSVLDLPLHVQAVLEDYRTRVRMF